MYKELTYYRPSPFIKYINGELPLPPDCDIVIKRYGYVTNDVKKILMPPVPDLNFYTYICESGKNTCSACLSLHGQVFRMSDAKEGINFPPLHPNCKCSVQTIYGMVTPKGFKLILLFGRYLGSILQKLTDPIYITEVERDENYKHNKGQLIPSSSMPDVFDFIIDQSRTRRFRYGDKTSEYNGCGWISMFNALHMLDKHEHPSDLILHLEEQPFLQGDAFGGMLGTYPWSVGGYFEEQGYDVEYSIKKNPDVAAGADANIMIYQRKDGTAHYVAFQATGEFDQKGNPIFLFLNYNDNGEPGYCKKTMDAFWRNTDEIWQIIISINKPPEEI